MEQNSSAFLANRKLIQALERRSHAVSCEEDCSLFRQGDAPSGLYIIHRGKATLNMKAATGENLIQMLAGAGSLLGLPAIVGKQPYSLTAIALKGAEVRFVSRKDFEEILRADPSLSINVCQVLAAEVQSARQVLSRF